MCLFVNVEQTRLLTFLERRCFIPVFHALLSTTVTTTIQASILRTSLMNSFSAAISGAHEECAMRYVL